MSSNDAALKKANKAVRKWANKEVYINPLDRLGEAQWILTTLHGMLMNGVYGDGHGELMRHLSRQISSNRKFVEKLQGKSSGRAE